MEETIQIPKTMYLRMSQALIGIEKVLKEREEANNDWIGEELALKLLGCQRVKLYELKKTGDVRYKAVGRRHQYSKKSIEKYNEQRSS